MIFRFKEFRAQGCPAIFSKTLALAFAVLLQLSLVFFSRFAHASICDIALSAQIQLDTQKQDQRYQAMGHGGIRPGNQAQFRVGTNGRAILVLHGFLASPFEVESIAIRLNQEGFTVYSPLVFGFGTSPQNANQVEMADYRQSVQTSFERLSTCYNDISLIGMSWGAALASDFVLNDSLGQRVRSLVLISPYFKAKQFGAEAINVWTSKYIEVLPNWVARLTAPNDHRVSRLYPQFHTPGLPLLTVIESLKFCDLLPAIDQRKKDAGIAWRSPVPTFLATTDADETVDPKFGRLYATDHYPNLTFLTYEKALRIPHQIPVADVNPQLPALLDRIVAHIQSSLK